MRIHPFIKLFILSLMMSVLSCVTAPKVTDIAELRYGDQEVDIVEKIGRGDSVLFFWIDDEIYHYRSYATRHTQDEYALLFANGRLLAVSDEITSYGHCLVLNEAVDWEECLLDVIAVIRGKEISMGSHDFSEAIEEQKHQEAESADAAVLVTAVSVPALVVTWPFAVMCGGMIAAGEVADDSVDCYKIMREVSEQTYNLLPRKADESVINLLDEIHPEFAISISDEHKTGRRVIERTWRCRRDGAFNKLDDVEISIGLKTGRVVWASLSSRWLKY